MFKTGITTVKDFRDGTKHKTRFFKRPRTVSITLYDDIQRENDSFELSEEFLFQFKDTRGAYKRTYEKRFDEFDGKITRQILHDFDKEKDIAIHDMGVSDGRSSLTLFNALKDSYPRLSFTASDYEPFIYTINRGKLTVCINSRDSLLEMKYGAFVFHKLIRSDYILYPFNCLLYAIVKHILTPRILKAYRENKVKRGEIKMFYPGVVAVHRDDKRFILKEFNILDSFNSRYQVIRAMNVLNKTYFSDDEFIKIIKNIYTALVEEGIFITGSNQDAGSAVNGGIYRKTNAGFERVYQSGEGSPVHDLIAAFKHACFQT
jgi:chemotaxis methyl-accepting protein methylase